MYEELSPILNIYAVFNVVETCSGPGFDPGLVRVDCFSLKWLSRCHGGQTGKQGLTGLSNVLLILKARLCEHIAWPLSYALAMFGCL